MPLQVNLTDADVRTIAATEAKAAVLRLACRMVLQRAAKDASDESRAEGAIRQQARAMVESRITRAVTAEETRSNKAAVVVAGARPDQLDVIGAQILVARPNGEADTDYRTRLAAAVDLETQPWRALLADALEAALNTVVNATGTPLETLIDRIATDLADSKPVKRSEALGG